MAFNQYKARINDANKLLSSLVGVSQFNTHVLAKMTSSPPVGFIKQYWCQCNKFCLLIRNTQIIRILGMW